MHFIATYLAKPKAIHAGDFILHLLSTCGHHSHNIDAASVTRGTLLREVAEAWAQANGHTLRIDWSSLTKTTPHD
ncbi:MAG: hypothetical protein V4672_13075 [Verrucomicrobiota bacterium]